MSDKSKGTSSDLRTLKIGSRVRCTDDGVEGRIAWANGVSVKIEWNDGEKVTWRRDSLAGRPIEILDADGGEGATEEPLAPAVPEQAATTESPTESVAIHATPEVVFETEVPATALPTPELATSPADETPATPPTNASEPTPPATSDTERTPPATNDSEPTPPAKPKRERKAPAEPKEKKVSALDAAAKVLAEENRPLSCKEMIEAMAAKGYWTSPGGKTPEATLYSAVLREVTTKGADARFTKTERGKFALNLAV